MKRHEYFQTKIKDLSPEFAEGLAYKVMLQEQCDAALFPGAYRRTLRIATDSFPEWFLEDIYIKDITDPETGTFTAWGAVPFRDWAVAMTQRAIEVRPDLETAGHAAATAAVESVILELMQDDEGVRP